ncbi:MAG: hypothetical protein CME70_22540 [Halobacteriovorax sp.]|nr:hypothetical protein [Halobacteriovorax sp.]|tara:strand:- start:61768 stop:61989 length:222 start_codon:yes stop_codon:yes gene_type:complete
MLAYDEYIFESREEIFDFYQKHEDFLRLIPNLKNLEKSLESQGKSQNEIEETLLQKADEDFSKVFYLEIGTGD